MEMENTSNARKLFQLNRATGSRKPTVSEIIKNGDGSIIANKEERLHRWTEYLSEQFNWPSATQLQDAEIPQEY